jgi:hypothetical protein
MCKPPPLPHRLEERNGLLREEQRNTVTHRIGDAPILADERRIETRGQSRYNLRIGHTQRLERERAAEKGEEFRRDH